MSSNSRFPSEPKGMPQTEPPASGDSSSDDEIHLQVLRSLRQIIHAVDVHSRRLAALHNITGPQLVCLSTLVAEGRLTTKGLAQAVHLTSSTVVGIVDRLEKRGLIRRERDRHDRRLVNLTPTDLGHELMDQAPFPLQESLVRGLSGLPPEEQREIADALERVVTLMGAEVMADPWPIIAPGPLDEDAPDALVD